MDYCMDSGLDYVVDSRLEVLHFSVVIGSCVAAARPLCGGIPLLVLTLLEPYRYPTNRELLLTSTISNITSDGVV